jgi:hypothetical protein
MLPTEGLVELSRWQFALKSMYHFIFVPLTLGLSWIVFMAAFALAGIWQAFGIGFFRIVSMPDFGTGFSPPAKKVTTNEDKNILKDTICGTLHGD